MYKLINDNAKAVVDQATKLGVPEYFELRNRLRSEPAIALDARFQKRYRAYWRMNVARLEQPFFGRYFEILATHDRSTSPDLKTITRELSQAQQGERKSLQFSFATKLSHMIDPTIPIYDSFVTAFYFFAPPAHDGPVSERMDALLEFHDFLRAEYDRVIRLGLLRAASDELRTRHCEGEEICDERIIDWLVWGWVSLLRKRVQFAGTALYE